jgi:hypothetical protein
MLLIIALTDTFAVEKLKDHGFVIGIIFISLGGFTKLAYKKYKEGNYSVINIASNFQKAI